MINRIKVFVFALSMAIGSVVQAQAYDPLSYDYGGGYQDFGGYMNLNWEISQPLGSTSDFIGKTSTRGFGFDARFALNDYVTLGFLTGWNYLFEKRDREIYDLSTRVQVSAIQSRYVYMTPLLVQGHYYFNDLSPNIKPYVGLGIGGYKVTYEKWWGTLVDSAKWWDFAWSPQAGVTIVSTDGGVGLHLGVKYTNVSFSYSDLEGVSMLGYNVGLALGL